MRKKTHTNFILLSRSRNVVGRFMKIYLHKPITIIKISFTSENSNIFNITSNHFNIFNKNIFLHVIPVQIIAPWQKEQLQLHHDCDV